MKTFRIVKAWTQDKNGMPKRNGWHVMQGDNWIQIYTTKKEAVLNANLLNKINTARKPA